MRLIDADALIAESSLLSGTPPTWDNPLGVGCVYGVAVDTIENAPTVDAQPVVHAKFTYYKNNGITDYFKCSDCGNVVNVYLDNFPEHKFCCNCGARMDG